MKSQIEENNLEASFSNESAMCSFGLVSLCLCEDMRVREELVHASFCVLGREMEVKVV